MQERETCAQKIVLLFQINVGKLILFQHSIEAVGACKDFAQDTPNTSGTVNAWGHK